MRCTLCCSMPCVAAFLAAGRCSRWRLFAAGVHILLLPKLRACALELPPSLPLGPLPEQPYAKQSRTSAPSMEHCLRPPLGATRSRCCLTDGRSLRFPSGTAAASVSSPTNPYCSPTPAAAPTTFGSSPRCRFFPTRAHRHGQPNPSEPLPSSTHQIGPPPRRGVPRPPCSPPLIAGRRNRRRRRCPSSLAPLLQAVGCQPMGSWSAGWAGQKRPKCTVILRNFQLN
jgi:hypothetical protein